MQDDLPDTPPDEQRPFGAEEIVESLTGAEAGRWLVHTLQSQHLVDLDRGTVERLPGPNASTNIVEGARPIRELKRCTVGTFGYWTMYSANPFIEYEWHLSTKVIRIEPLPDPG